MELLTNTLDQAEEEILAASVSDEALEAAGDKERPAYTQIQQGCTFGLPIPPYC